MGKLKAIFKFIWFLFDNQVTDKAIDVGKHVVELVKKAKTEKVIDPTDIGEIAGGVVEVVGDIKGGLKK